MFYTKSLNVIFVNSLYFMLCTVVYFLKSMLSKDVQYAFVNVACFGLPVESEADLETRLQDKDQVKSVASWLSIVTIYQAVW